MKMKKFEMLIRDIDHYLGPAGIVRESRSDEQNERGYSLSPIEFFIENNGKNEYINLLLKNSFRRQYAFLCQGRTSLNEYKKEDVIKVVEKIRECNSCQNGRIQYCNTPGHLMFWLIFIVSIDNENYNENLSVVSDVAYLLGFDETKLADWITAVKGVIEGKRLNEMKYQTEDAERFFIRE